MPLYQVVQTKEKEKEERREEVEHQCLDTLYAIVPVGMDQRERGREEKSWRGRMRGDVGVDRRLSGKACW